jgi:amino acid permease
MAEAPHRTTSEETSTSGSAAAAEEPTSSATETTSEQDEQNERGFQFWIIASIGGSIAACLVLFLVAMAAGTISGRWENVAALVSVIRDLMLIFLILQAILIGVALIAMVIQITALINLLQNEIQPILENTQQASKTVSGTAQFISKRVTAPVVRTFAVLAGARAFLSEVGGIRRAIQPKPGKNGASASPGPELKSGEVNSVEGSDASGK